MKVTSFKKTPMGGYIVDGYVNHNKIMILKFSSLQLTIINLKIA